MATTLERVQEIIMALDDKYKANWLLEELEAELISQGAEPKEDEDVETHVRYTKARGFFVAPDERESKDHMGEIPEFWKNHWQRVRADKGEGK